MQYFPSFVPVHASTPMPVLFIGHGSPVNIVRNTPARKTLQALGEKLPEPRAILCISAHWLTNGAYVSTGQTPDTLHDFGGFSDDLYRQFYPVKGASKCARSVVQRLGEGRIHQDPERGLDHGAWGVLMPMFPDGDIPVFQLSIDFSRCLVHHYELAKALRFLREEGVLIVCSGNIVHNQYKANFSHSDKVYDWARDFDRMVVEHIKEKDYATLLRWDLLGSLGEQAHPTPEHYIPLVYALGLTSEEDKPLFFNEYIESGSVSMTSVVFSRAH